MGFSEHLLMPGRQRRACPRGQGCTPAPSHTPAPSRPGPARPALHPCSTITSISCVTPQHHPAPHAAVTRGLQPKTSWQRHSSQPKPSPSHMRTESTTATVFFDNRTTATTATATAIVTASQPKPPTATRNADNHNSNSNSNCTGAQRLLLSSAPARALLPHVGRPTHSRQRSTCNFPVQRMPTVQMLLPTLRRHPGASPACTMHLCILRYSPCIRRR
jgi:hypothetical protein